MDYWKLPRGLPNTPPASGYAPRVQWADPAAVEESPKTAWTDGGIFLGQNISGESAGKIVGINDDRHIVTVAGSRAGKGVAVILPNLAYYRGSVLVLDPKGENAAETAERRGKGNNIQAGGLGQDVYVLDPFNRADVPDEYLAGWNPLADLHPDHPDFVDDCASIADALVVAPAGKQDDHWNSSARLVIRALVAWVVAAPDIEKRTLGELRRLLHLPPRLPDGLGFDDHLDKMVKNPEIGEGLPAEMAGALWSMGEDERGSVLSTARQNVLFLSSPQMVKMLEGGGRTPDLFNWKMGGVSIYLSLPANRLHTHARFFRLFINRLLAAVENNQAVPKTRALMLLDEMHVLGHMATLETAAGLLAGSGIRIHSIWQDFAQLKQLYRERWETFLGNASILQSFGLNDLTTLKYVSERLGKSSTLSISQGEQSDKAEASGFTAQTRSIQGSPLATPDELAVWFSRQSGKQLVMFTGTSPIILERTPFYGAAFDSVRRPKNDRGKHIAERAKKHAEEVKRKARESAAAEEPKPQTKPKRKPAPRTRKKLTSDDGNTPNT